MADLNQEEKGDKAQSTIDEKAGSDLSQKGKRAKKELKKREPLEKEVALKQSYEKIEEKFKKGARIAATGVRFAEKGACMVWRMVKLKSQAPLLRRKIERLLTQLGGEIYDLNVQGIKDILGNKKVKEMIGQVDKFNEELELVQQKLASIGKKGH